MFAELRRRGLTGRFLRFAILPALSLTGSLAAQRPVLPPSEYHRFESISSDNVSPDGTWFAYVVNRAERDPELRYRRIADGAQETSIPLGASPTFTSDSRYLTWYTSPSIKDRERLTRERKPIEQTLTVLTLATGAQQTFPAVRSTTVSPDLRYAALHGYAPTEIRNKGATLRVVELTTGTTATFHDVAEFRWTDRGGLLVMVVATGTATANGVQIYDPATGRIRTLETSSSHYRGMTLRRGTADIVLYRSTAPAPADSADYDVVIWRDLTAASPTRQVLDSTHAALGSARRVVATTAPRWDAEGTQLALTLQTRPARPDSARRPGLPADSLSSVQIWHSRDVLIQPQQRGRTTPATRSMPAVWHPGSNTLTPVVPQSTATPSLLEGWRHAVDRSDSAYAWGAMFGRRYSDVFLTDVATGTRTQVLTRVRHSWESSSGRYLLWFDGRDYWTHEIATGTRTNITAGMRTSFANTGSDSPTDILPPYGVGGWLAEDAAVFLYDAWDVWRISPDGRSRTRLTNGAPDRVVHRLQTMGSSTSPGINPSLPRYYSLRGHDKKTGWGRQVGDGPVQRLVLTDKALRSLRRADSADVFLYRAEDRADSPDIFVTDANFQTSRQLTASNTFLADYAWVRSELVSYTTEGGIPSQAVLVYPANHDPSRKYPMIVYTYERLSDGLHTWQVPNERAYYNETGWALDGYFVLLPDIIFTPREPGVSTIQSVRAAVRTVTRRGLVDPARVGHIGHSWGGYEAAYLGTHGGDFLATTIAGAGIFDLVSFLGQIHWAAGTPEVDHSETGQARMQVPYWEDPAAHRRNSPLENLHNMKIPMLMAHGNKDGTVEFFQATEFYNLARRAGKDVVLLVYDGEDHSFTKRPNALDYQRRIREWFGHYLKGEPAPAWITEGIKASDHPAEVKRLMDKYQPPAAAGGTP